MYFIFGLSIIPSVKSFFLISYFFRSLLTSFTVQSVPFLHLFHPVFFLLYITFLPFSSFPNPYTLLPLSWRQNVHRFPSAPPITYSVLPPGGEKSCRYQTQKGDSLKQTNKPILFLLMPSYTLSCRKDEKKEAVFLVLPFPAEKIFFFGNSPPAVATVPFFLSVSSSSSSLSSNEGK